MASSSHVCVAATTIGASHIESGRSGEDWYALSCSEDGKWTSAVVCDGCGSVSHALEGAKFISTFIAEYLTAMAPDLERRGPGEWTVDRIITIVVKLREAMRSNFETPITDYSATIVAAMVSRAGGFIVHIGDGIASVFSADKTATGLNLRVVGQSDPENGEYANETYYVTAPDWLRHLRVTPFGAADCILLSTDGAQSLFYKANTPRADEISTMLRDLSLLAPDDAGKFLENILNGDMANSLSNDDKTLVVLADPVFWKSAANSITPPPFSPLSTARPAPAPAAPKLAHRAGPAARPQPKMAIRQPGSDARTGDPRNTTAKQVRRYRSLSSEFGRRRLEWIVLVAICFTFIAGTAIGVTASNLYYFTSPAQTEVKKKESGEKSLPNTGPVTPERAESGSSGAESASPTPAQNPAAGPGP